MQDSYEYVPTNLMERQPLTVIVLFSGGSSVEGHFKAPYSGLSIDFSAMNQIIAFHEAEYVYVMIYCDAFG